MISFKHDFATFCDTINHYRAKKILLTQPFSQFKVKKITYDYINNLKFGYQ